jgi:hypothetical protein
MIVNHVRGDDLLVLDAQSWKEGTPLTGPWQTTADQDDCLRFPVSASADGNWLAAGKPSGFRVWDTDTPDTWLAFAPDGR